MEKAGVAQDFGAVRTELLDSRHIVDDFDCGVDSITTFLKRYALNAPKQGTSKTWVFSANGKVLAYYTLAIVTVDRAEATPRMAKGMPDHPIPCVLLARLGVDQSVQGEGLGAEMLESAMRKAVELSDNGLPMKAMLVHAVNEKAAEFYRHHGFEKSPTDPLHFLMLLKYIKISFRINQRN